MKKIERLTKNVEKAIKEKKLKLSGNYYEVENFINDGLSYIEAIKQGRMLVAIMKVSQSGMSRNMVFTACTYGKSGGKINYRYRYYNLFFKTLGFRVNQNNELVIGGCGMDMVFHTNYTVIRTLRNLGFISSKQCRELEQKTPQYI
jgi:hypothetical protein